MKRIIQRVNTVPKYQSLVINFKIMMFLFLYFLLMYEKPVGLIFWSFGISFNVELFLKLYYIEWKFMKMIIWNYIDFY